MNIYLVERTDDIDWDEFSAMVVAAEDEADARSMVPGGEHYPWGSSKTIDPPRTIVTVSLGSFLPRGIVLASYNAG